MASPDVRGGYSRLADVSGAPARTAHTVSGTRVRSEADDEHGAERSQPWGIVGSSERRSLLSGSLLRSSYSERDRASGGAGGTPGGAEMFGRSPSGGGAHAYEGTARRRIAYQLDSPSDAAAQRMMARSPSWLFGGHGVGRGGDLIPPRQTSLRQVSHLDQVELNLVEVRADGEARHRRLSRVQLLRELNAEHEAWTNRAPRLELGELRRVNPSRRVSQAGCALLVRRACVLVSLEKVNAILSADKCILVLPGAEMGGRSFHGNISGGLLHAEDESPRGSHSSRYPAFNLSLMHEQLVDALKQAAEDARIEQAAEDARAEEAAGKWGATRRSLGTDDVAVEEEAEGGGEQQPQEEPTSPPRGGARASSLPTSPLGRTDSGAAHHDSSVLPFALRALDLLLSAAVRVLSLRVESTEAMLAEALEQVTKNTSLRALEVTKQHKGDANKLRTALNDMDGELERRLQDKDDLIAMEEVAGISQEEHELHQRIMGQRAELVIDAAAMDMEALIDRMELLEKEIDSTEDLLSLKLDTMRNQILKVEVGLAIVQIPLALGAMITGMFGMNLYSGVEDETKIVFWGVVAALFSFTILGSLGGWWYMGRSEAFKSLDGSRGMR
eukprot:CAMPEP_0119179814 /NCGR_PEP_ID=MMETSP1315-20130426/55371_1 /TAXON_ID=676789 /ORGANISM="Prasinoderma singularis, Strain RCC927" /LENGTH=613 /DNA_ID=CAMNT_0007174067 /DNA_START=68 /DNA_END=1909 /DNA_ORIENTATION=-